MKPVLLIVDDDPNVLRAVERDLRLQYGSRFRIFKTESGQKALELVKQLKLRNEALALLLVDQRMPHMSGVAFLEQAMNIFPDAKRVLLTAYADTEAAIRSINKAKIDYYLMKPWDPPQEYLYPILDDLLDDWWASFKHPFEGIRIIGLRWSPKSYEVKYFLARNGVPYQWLDLEGDEEARRLLSYVESTIKNEHSNLSNATTTTTSLSNSFSVFDHDKTENNNNNNNKNNNNSRSSIRSASSLSYSPSVNSSSLHLPLVIFPDGSHMEEPSSSELAEKIGLKT
ncbi:MAG: response regulator, partial [Thermoproteota archaeon]|nr:response regulator [Thermoproteota archaeon]